MQRESALLILLGLSRLICRLKTEYLACIILVACTILMTCIGYAECTVYHTNKIKKLELNSSKKNGETL